MRPAGLLTILLLLPGCTSTRPPPNIVVSNASSEAAAHPIATRFCARHNRNAIFKTKLGDSFQFDCVRRRR